MNSEIRLHIYLMLFDVMLGKIGSLTIQLATELVTFIDPYCLEYFRPAGDECNGI